MKKLLPFVIVPAIFSCSGNQGKNAETVHLNFDPAVGESHHMVYEFEVYNSVTGDSPHFKIEVTARIASKSNGRITMVTHYDNISMSGKIHGKEINLDAAELTGAKDTTDAAVVASSVFAYWGKSFETVYDGHHNKLEEHQVQVTGDSSVVAAESKVQLIGRYPEKDLKTGDGWDSEGPIRIGSNEIRTMHYSVSSISDSEVKIDVTGEVDSNGEKFGQEYKVTGKLNGSILADRKNGWQKRADINIDFTLDMGDKKTPMKQHISFVEE